MTVGLHMPCRSVIFYGTDVWLGALNWRQAAGRAGRRGLDTHGNSIFYGTQHSKILQLYRSKLPSICGSALIEASTVLRLQLRLEAFKLQQSLGMKLPHAWGPAEVAADKKMMLDSISRLTELSVQSHIEVTTGQAQPNHLALRRFEYLMMVKYLYHEKFLAEDGSAQGLAGLASHLSFTQPSNFVLSHLVQSGLLVNLFSRVNPALPSHEAQLEFVRILSHLFGVVPVLNDAEPEYILPPLPQVVRASIDSFNRRSVDFWARAMRAFVTADRSEQLGAGPAFPISRQGTDKTLPPKASLAIKETALEGLAMPVFLRAPSMALWNPTDAFGSWEEMRRFARLEFGIDQQMPVYTHDSLPKNGYLVGFFLGKSRKTLISDYGIRADALFPLIVDFKLVVQAVATSLQQALSKERNKDTHPARGLVAVALALAQTVKKRFSDSYWDDEDVNY
eukprot:TRINITY_DN6332_c0_g1_i1.p1 TRINITY_DN6332_c0_g1~~TRINITY_DN6332_c0_g1_i1.p1  ORF type:complete len:450 (+),score=81.97 TRINITY_DN6332_c0_g1_i1:67-1416(+)